MPANIDHSGFVYLTDNDEKQKCNERDLVRLHVFMHNLKVCGMAHQDIIAQGFQFAVEMYSNAVEQQIAQMYKTEGVLYNKDMPVVKERAAFLLHEVVREHFA
jgi:hypothetical protein